MSLVALESRKRRGDPRRRAIGAAVRRLNLFRLAPGRCEANHEGRTHDWIAQRLRYQLVAPAGAYAVSALLHEILYSSRRSGPTKALRGTRRRRHGAHRLVL